MDEKKFQKWMIGQLRRLSTKTPSACYSAKDEAWAASRVGYGRYKCAICTHAYAPDIMKRDHIDPVVDPQTGFVDWNTYIARTWCPRENYQIICKPCHDAKSKAENAERRIAKRKRAAI